MFVASACNFILATILVGTYLAGLGMTIHTRLVEYGDRPPAEMLLLVEHQLIRFNTIIYWVSYLVVSVWARQPSKVVIH